ncbi:lipoprotein BUG3 [Streptococcus iniae]|uniref:lipoprotein BUG3 n=1 Tax=Streptococcus iniae TaxID=1346 RepID=UPI0008DADB64|nr:lipoprotein BUG3 [Streptococcus iniae]OHX28308.1 lipoprotein BUG3 [Streptococcus iniae]RLV27086.1 lipoprotein BUG3 [Streptococcus iniae]
MYKRLKCVLPIVFLGIILVGCQMNSEQKSAKKENKTSKHVSHQKMTKKEQLAYLKGHEQEIIDFVKSQSKKVESVQIDWDEVIWSEGGVITKDYYINVYGSINNVKQSSWSVCIPVNDDKTLNIKEIFFGSPLRIRGELVE